MADSEGIPVVPEQTYELTGGFRDVDVDVTYCDADVDVTYYGTDGKERTLAVKTPYRFAPESGETHVSFTIRVGGYLGPAT